MLMYEDLTKIVANRERLFADRDTYWGRNRYDLCMLLDICKFPRTAYHEYYGEVSIAPILLKRRYLAALKRRLLKLQRRHIDVSVAVRRHYKKLEYERYRQLLRPIS